MADSKMVETNYVEMMNGWRAWQEVAYQWANHSDDMNESENNALVNAIRWWAETLVTLRVRQTPKLQLQAWQRAAQSYKDSDDSFRPDRDR